MVSEQVDLVLLVVAVSLVDAGGCCDSIALGHCLFLRAARPHVVTAINVLSEQAEYTEKTLDINFCATSHDLIQANDHFFCGDRFGVFSVDACGVPSLMTQGKANLQ